MLPADRSERKKHISVSWCINAMSKRPLTIREYFLLVIIALCMLTILLTIIGFKTQRKNTITSENQCKTSELTGEKFLRRWTVLLKVSSHFASANRPRKGSDGICTRARWLPSAVTVAGGIGRDSGLNGLSGPNGLFLDENGTLYVADTYNQRIMKWMHGASLGSLVAGGKGNGSSAEQLSYPSDLVVDRNGTLYIADSFNKRIQQWSAEASSGQTIINGIIPKCIALDGEGSLYTADWTQYQLRKWRKDDKVGQVLAIGLSYPTRLYVDRNHSVYVADTSSHRVLKIDEGTIDMAVVAGGSFGTDDHQLNYPYGVTVDELGNVYVADTKNHRIMSWSKGATSGTLIAGGHSNGSRSDQLDEPVDLQFDREGNPYVADANNHRVQKFLLDKSSC